MTLTRLPDLGRGCPSIRRDVHVAIQDARPTEAQIVDNDAGHSDIDFKPVVKLFTPDAQCTWLLTELGLDDIAYSLCDLGMGTPAIGFVCMRELREARGPLGLPIERDLHFDADKTLSAYAAEAREHCSVRCHIRVAIYARIPPRR